MWGTASSTLAGWGCGIAGARLTAALLCALLLPSTLLPGQLKPSEYAVKAAYLLNFGKFMRVSPGAEPNAGSFNICVIGEDPFGRSLEEITANEQIDGRPVRVIRQEKPDPQACAIAYIGVSDDRRMEQDLEALRDSDTLTVSDEPGFLQHGGMVQFLLVSDHVRFSINLEPVRRTHLILSSDLLRIAVSVSGNQPGEVKP